MKTTAILSLVFSLSLCPSAFAHGDGSTLMGTVTAVSAGAIVVRAADGDSVEVPVGEKTTYSKGDAAAAASDVSVGMRVVIDVDATAGAVAKSVRLPAAATPNAAEKSAHEDGDSGHTGHEHHGKALHDEGHAHSSGE